LVIKGGFGSFEKEAVNASKKEPCVMGRRSFTDEFRRRLVEEHVIAKRSIAELCRQYQVGETALRRWVSRHREGLADGDAKKLELARDLEQAQQRVAELEGALGRTVMELDFMRRCLKRAGLTFPSGSRS
jgi:transposase-like protein